MNETPQAKLIPTAKFNWLWLIPVLTIAMVAFIVWRNLPAQGETLTLYFNDVASLKPIQTKLQYRGLIVGQVEELALTPDHLGVKVSLKVDESIVPLLRENTNFWLVKPEIGSSGISGITTLVSGPYITFTPGNGEPKRVFAGAQSPPLKKTEGLNFTLSSGLKNNITPGDPVYYKQVVVGNVYAYELLSDRVMFYAQIQPEYQALLRLNSVFWEDSGLEFDMGLLGVSVSAAPLMSLLSGGVSFATPAEYGAAASADSEFQLRSDKVEEWPNWQPLIALPKVRVEREIQSNPALLPPSLKDETLPSGDK